jgi:hypothetical protein
MMLIAATARRSLVAPSPCKGEGWDGGAVLASRSCPMCPRLRDSSHILVNSSWILAGCGPAAGHFSCLAKKSNQKKATPATLPFGVEQGMRTALLSACGTVCACKRKLLLPKKGSSKREAHKLALRAQTYALLIRFDDPFFWGGAEPSVTGENATAKGKTLNPRTKSKSVKPLSEVPRYKSGST